MSNFISSTSRPEIFLKTDAPDVGTYDYPAGTFKKLSAKISYPVTKNNTAGFGSQEKRELALNRTAECPFVDKTSASNPPSNLYAATSLDLRKRELVEEIKKQKLRKRSPRRVSN